MGDSLTFRRIIDSYRHWDNLSAVPCGKYKQLQLGLISRGHKGGTAYSVQGIGSESCLGVLKPSACLHHEPEIGEFVCESVFPGHVFRADVPASDYYGLRVLPHCFKKKRDVLRKMLTVRINGNHMCETLFRRLSEAALEGMAFAAVADVPYDTQSCNGPASPFRP